jgi:hypothetical protein
VGDGKKLTPSEELERRKSWFFECQLRGLNLDTFRGAHEGDEATRAFLDLVSERAVPPGFGAGQVGVTPPLRRQYKDSEQPVWSVEEREQRDSLNSTCIGKTGDWLGMKKPERLVQDVAALKEAYDNSPLASVIEKTGFADALRPFPRRPAWKRASRVEHPGLDPLLPPPLFAEDHSLPHAIARAEIAAAKPWLIPELYNEPHADATPVKEWIENAERFVHNYEQELRQITGKGDDWPLKMEEAGGLSAAENYRKSIQELIDHSLTRSPSNHVKVGFWGEDGDKTTFDVKISTATFGPKPLHEYPNSFAKYWGTAFDLKDICLNAANSDMGLCILIRAFYLYAALPASAVWKRNGGLAEPRFPSAWEVPWRVRVEPGEAFNEFLKQRGDKTLLKALKLEAKFEEVTQKLRILLELNAANPRSAALTWSSVNGEIIKQAILRYKFWLDEPFRAAENHKKEDPWIERTWEGTWRAVGIVGQEKLRGINKAREDIGKGVPLAEMEYWSENHIIMFASSEYLAGQLWPEETFQPARDFLGSDKTGEMPGAKRKERGRARVLKYLNHRLLFGWMEFNSSGYYREHLWALLNLVDFATDEEIRNKAALVTDLLLFDMVRYLHKGAVGACGGRSQFGSRSSGWDNALGDVIEIMLGTRGLFRDGAGEIGCSFATSTYRVPEVLLAIGLNPPRNGFEDRSRVSITFEEGAKYGIQYSEDSDQKDSLERGFRPKREKRFKRLHEINQDIVRSHHDYTQREDDTVFWWSLSAYFNKQVAKATAQCVDKFKLQNNNAFSALRTLVDVLAPLSNRAAFATVGGLVAGLPAAVGGWFAMDILGERSEEISADELSIFLEGSTRTRANIYTYRNRDVMLSCIQDFRTGQLNYQSCVNQATISTELNVFTTSTYPGIYISNIPVAAVGGLAGAGAASRIFAGPAAPAFTFWGAVGGALAAVLTNEGSLKAQNLIGDFADGPGWWTGYWALPMILQHKNAAILMYDFTSAQEKLTRTGSHVWFPKEGFTDKEERRTSAYENENFFLFDIMDIGPKGFWLFGRKLHKRDASKPENDEEAYIGVFSNQRPEWQDKDSFFYEARVKEQTEDALEELKKKVEDLKDELGDNKDEIFTMLRTYVINQPSNDTWVWKNVVKHLLTERQDLGIPNHKGKIRELVDAYIDLLHHERVWNKPAAVDYFKDRDWYASGKNVWIIHVGNKDEYGSFEMFKDRLRRAPIELDDVGDMECEYHMPMPGGGTDRVSLEYKGDRKVNGHSVQTDFYPRFQNPFVRGGLVEWGQREYVIEYEGKSLVHDFSSLADAKRSENASISEGAKDILKALVIYIRTGSEEMEQFSVAQATVIAGCETLTVDEVIAAGEVEEDTTHDAEWIFLDKSGKLSPDMTITISHPATSDGDDDPEWKMSFSLKALLGDLRLYDCAVSFSDCHFKDQRRSIGPLPFSVPTNNWRRWAAQENEPAFASWRPAARPDWRQFYYDHIDALAADRDGRLWHRALRSCPRPDSMWRPVAPLSPSVRFSDAVSVYALSAYPRSLCLFAVIDGALHTCFAPEFDDVWRNKGWTPVRAEHTVTIFGLELPNVPPQPVVLAVDCRIVARPAPEGWNYFDVFVQAADRHLYAAPGWYSGSTDLWRRIKTVPDVTPLPGAAFEVTDDRIFLLDTQRSLWTTPFDRADRTPNPDWSRISPDGREIVSFTVLKEGGLYKLLAIDTNGQVLAAHFDRNVLTWETAGGPGFVASPVGLSWAVPEDGELYVFARGLDGKIYTTHWRVSGVWTIWRIVDPVGHSFEADEVSPVYACSRVKGQIELFVTAKDGKRWKTWWS